MNLRLHRYEARLTNPRRRPVFCGSLLPNLALVLTALPLPAAFAQGAVLSSEIQPAVTLGQVDAVLRRVILVALPPSGLARVEGLPQVQKGLPRPTVRASPALPPAHAEALKQLYPVLPRFVLIASPLPKVPGIKALAQPHMAGRLALQAPALQPGQGPVLAAEGLVAADCDDADARAECLMRQDRATDWRVGTAQAIDPVSGAALVPGVTWNPIRTPYKLDEVLAYLAGVDARPGRTGSTSSSSAVSPTDYGGATPVGGGTSTGGSSTSTLLNPTTIFNMIMGSDYNTVTVDLTRASTASYVTGLTLSSYTNLVLTAAPGSTLQLENISLAAGSPALPNSLVLASAPNGLIAVFGGGADGTGLTQAATVKSLTVVQSGAADVVLLGLMGTTGTVTEIIQSGSGVKTFQLDNFSNDMLIRVKQSGNAAQMATGIVLRAGPGSSFLLSQQ